jgi:hypothetical protein
MQVDLVAGVLHKKIKGKRKHAILYYTFNPPPTKRGKKNRNLNNAVSSEF